MMKNKGSFIVNFNTIIHHQAQINMKQIRFRSYHQIINTRVHTLGKIRAIDAKSSPNTLFSFSNAVGEKNR